MMTIANQSCIFCRIISGKPGASFVLETENVVALDDIDPKASTHILIVPKRHIASMDALTADDSDLISEMVLVGQHVARIREIEISGYRLLTNVGANAGQSVFHLHWHLLGGGPLIDLG